MNEDIFFKFFKKLFAVNFTFKSEHRKNIANFVYSVI